MNRQLTEGHKIVLFLSYVAVIYTCQLSAAIFEQKIYKVPYASNASAGTSDLFNDNITPYSLTSAIASIIGFFLIKDEELNFNIPVTKLLKISVSDLLIHITLIAAMMRTDYTTMIVVNSSSLLSVVMVGAFCSGVKETLPSNEERDDAALNGQIEPQASRTDRIGREKIWICLIIVIGVSIFSLNQPAKQTKNPQQTGGAFITFLLFVTAILFQGLRPDFAAQVKQEYQPNPLFLYFSINGLTAILALVTSIFTWKIGYFVNFILNHDRLLIDLTCYAILNATGALFMYKLVSIFRQHIYPMVAELRRCLTICLNVVWYGHHLAGMQWFGIFIVFGGIMVQIINNYNLTSRILPNDNIRSRQGKNYNKIIAKQEGWSARKYDPDEINDDVEGLIKTIFPYYQPMMDVDEVFSNPFHSNIPNINKEIASWKLKPIVRFPYTEFIVDGDVFFKKVWQMIDRSKEYFWMTTYAIDSSPAADTTLLKLIQASKRGVNVVLFVDNVQFWAKQQLIQRFQNCGGRFLLLNPQWRLESLKSYLNKDVWRRHHQKLIVSDAYGLIGSANIQGSYAGIRYGSYQYQDLNYLTENIALDQYRKHFVDTADQYGFSLHTKYENQTLLRRLGKLYPNSEFYPPDKYKLLHNDPLNKKREIEQSVLNMVEKAEKEIKIVQPYHYPMIKFDRAMRNAADRGVISSILTSGQRDQPVFRKIFNYMLFQRLIMKGINVFQTKQRLLHSKVYLADGRYINLGSMNNDRWSWKINNEVNLAIDDPREYEWLDNYFQHMLGKSRPVTKNYTISASRAASIAFWQKFLYLSQILMSKQGLPEQAYIKTTAQIVEDLQIPK